MVLSNNFIGGSTLEDSTIMRNIKIIKEVLYGKSYAECSDQFGLTVPTIGNAIRLTLELLKEHTDIDVSPSASYYYVLEKQNEIKKFLSEPFPKVNITYAAKIYLRETYGKYYARDPKKVVDRWSDITKKFNYYRSRSDLISIQNWLASEGYFVGNVITEPMLNFALNTLKDNLALINKEQDDCSFVIKKINRTGWKTKLMISAEIKQGDHKVTRQFSLDLIPE